MAKVENVSSSLREMLKGVSAKTGRKAKDVSGLHAPASTGAPRAESPSLPATAPKRHFGDESLTSAIPDLIRSLEKHEGYRIGVLGESGAGKTSAIKLFLAQPFDGITLIHDEKAGPPQFEGFRVERASLSGVPNEAHTVVFRGDPFKSTRVDVDSVAKLALKLARYKVPVRLVIDELDRAVSPGGKALTSEAVRECITQGRAMGLCVLWSTQLPQRAPVEMLDNASALVIGRCGPRAANYLEERCYMTNDVVSAIMNLRAHYEDNRTVGELCVWRNGKKWNGVVYENR